jgi:hypothetical protein
MGDDCGATSPVIPHPSFHLPSYPHTTIALPEREFAMLWQWLPAALKKKLKKSKKKKTYIVLCTLKCTKVFCFQKYCSSIFGF